MACIGWASLFFIGRPRATPSAARAVLDTSNALPSTDLAWFLIPSVLARYWPRRRHDLAVHRNHRPYAADAPLFGGACPARTATLARWAWAAGMSAGRPCRRLRSRS